MYIKKQSATRSHAVKLTIVLLFFSFAKNFAQDIHFSQFQSTPLYINAALTGSGEENFRLSNCFRSQWNRIDYPYNTLMIAADNRFRMLGRTWGAGLMLVHDESSGNNLVADKFYISVSHAFYFRNHKITAGIQPGLVVKKFDRSNLSFGNQFDIDNQVFNPSIPGSEILLNDALSYIDLNAGILWQSRIKNFIPALGFAVSHLNRPHESFYTYKNADPLALKYTFHGRMVVPLTDKLGLMPVALYSFTSGAREFNLGSLVNFYPGNAPQNLQSVYGYGALRINPVRNFDAAVLGIGGRLAGFDVCFSYDINISSLRTVSRLQGGYEISLVFTTFRKKTAASGEPCFML